MAEELIKNVAKSEVFHLADLVQGEEGQVVSLTLLPDAQVQDDRLRD